MRNAIVRNHLKEKGPCGPFYQLWLVLAKGRHLLQILLKALHIPLTIFYWRDSKMKFNLFQPRSICFNLGQFVLVFLVANKKIFLAPSIFSSSSFFSSSLLTSLTTPSLLSQHLSPYSFYLNAYLVSLEPQTFGLYYCCITLLLASPSEAAAYSL